MYTTNFLIQLKVSLQGSDPLIWRRIIVYDTITFFELHHFIQVAMGWKNYHLFEFEALNNTIGLPDPEMPDIIDSKTVTLESVITEPGDIEKVNRQYRRIGQYMHDWEKNRK